MTKKGPDAAREDLERSRPFLATVAVSSGLYGIEPAVIAAIVSREMRWSPTALDTKGVQNWIGDHGHGCGPGQRDDRSHPEWCEAWRRGDITLETALATIPYDLTQKLNAIRRLCPKLTGDELLRAALAAYNCGEVRVKQALEHGLDVDHHTAGADYSADVMSRVPVFAEAFGALSS